MPFDSYPHNFSQVLRYHSNQQPNATALVYLDDGETVTETLSYAELDQIASQGAQWLLQQLKPGDRVALVFAPGTGFIKAFFACLYAGVIAVPINPPDNDRAWPRLQKILINAGTKFVLTEGSRLIQSLEKHLLNGDESETNLLLKIVDLSCWKSMPSSDEQPYPSQLESIAFLQYTSGTTSDPKGVMITHQNILHNQHFINDLLIDDPCIIVSWLPLYHDMGLIGTVLQPIFVGGTSVLMPPASFITKPLRWLTAISRFRGTTCAAPDFAYRHCIERIADKDLQTLDLTSLRSVISGAERVRAETLEKFVKKFSRCGFKLSRFSPCYGLAESTLLATGVAMNQNPTWDSNGNVSCGQAKSIDIAIIDPQTKEVVEPGNQGEIWLRGKSISAGYWQQPAVNKTVFGQCHPEDGSWGWFRTGDLGHINDGQLYVSGRMKELFIVRGRNIFPQDIEVIAQACHPALHNRPGAAFTFEEEDKVILVQEVNRRHTTSLDFASVLADVRQALTAELSLQLHDVLLVRHGSIPMTTSGKIQRLKTREHYQKGKLSCLDLAW